LVSVVIPTQITEKIPSKPSVNLPKRPDNTTLGTKSSAVVEMDSKLANKETELRVNAMLERERERERERLEDAEYGDQL
jgi:hypothetical protein